MGKLIDLTGQKIGWLTVLGRDLSKKRTYWNCECICGNRKSIRGDNLARGRSTSCGCYHKNVASRKSTNKKYNKVNNLGNGTTELLTSKSETILIDSEDYDKVKDYCWSRGAVGYAVARDSDIDAPSLMHRLIMNPCKDEVVDHMNHNKLDNRKKNLRLCEQRHNARNTVTPSDNTSGHKGVYWNKEKRKWNVKIGYENKSIDYGYFDSIEEAIKKRAEVEEFYFGEFSYKNSMEEAQDFVE